MSTRRAFLGVMAGATVAGSTAGSVVAFAQTNMAETERLGLKGYDPVAYFTLAAPTPGLERFEYVWDGVRYRFASAQNREMFRAHPDKYAPQFGGQCAMNMANGNRREPDPTVWMISNGNLYVFASQVGSERFRADAEANAAKAAANWQKTKTAPSQ
jgi:YHS domain-containing protein